MKGISAQPAARCDVATRSLGHGREVEHGPPMEGNLTCPVVYKQVPPTEAATLTHRTVYKHVPPTEAATLTPGAVYKHVAPAGGSDLDLSCRL